MQISIIIPCYNESNRLDIKNISRFLSSNSDLSFVFVNDGSTDKTLEILFQFQKSIGQQIKVINLPKNQGKAEAVRQGILWSQENSSAEFIGYWDADLSTPLEDILLFKKHLIDNLSINCIYGSRVLKLGTPIKRKISRHYLGRIFATAASLCLDEPIYDSQCGAKLFRREIILFCFSKPFLSRWLFDLEILFRLKNNSFRINQIVFEHPVTTWQDNGTSKVSWLAFLKAPFDLLMIYINYQNRSNSK